MQIGELAKLRGLGVETVRFYERQGLVPARRSSAGYREFEKDAPARFAWSALGSWRHQGRRTRSKLDEIKEKAEQLEAMRRAPEGLLNCCHGKGKASDCPILESLEG